MKRKSPFYKIYSIHEIFFKQIQSSSMFFTSLNCDEIW